MQQVVERPRQRLTRSVSRRTSDQHEKTTGLKDLMQLYAEYNRRIVEIGSLMRLTGSGGTEAKRRIGELARQQQECYSRIKEVIRCIMGWRY